MTTIATAPTEEIDARSEWQRQLDALDADEFSQAEMNALDVAAVHVYKRARAVLPSDLIDSSRTGDPAAAIRQWAYEYAYSHPGDIHSRTPGRIVHHVRGRLRQRLKRLLEVRRRENPAGFNVDAFIRCAEIRSEDRREKGRDIFSTTRPVKRPQPIKYRKDRSPLESEGHLAMLDLYGKFIPEDQRQFIFKGHRNGQPIREALEVLDRLHTRRPTRAEYWNGVLNGDSQRTARADLAKDTELHADTVAAIADEVCPAVSERFSTGPRPADSEDVDRQRLHLTREEVQRVLLERFDVLYEE